VSWSILVIVANVKYVVLGWRQLECGPMNSPSPKDKVKQVESRLQTGQEVGGPLFTVLLVSESDRNE
jgi:hypothetical protein